MTPEEFLLDTLEYYTQDTKRRCVKENDEIGTCYYSPENAGNSLSKGCAIGRHLSPEVQKQWDDNAVTGIKDIMLKGELAELAPDWMQKMSPDFLQACQRFHDIESNWINSGLSEKGKSKVKNIIGTFNLNQETFTKFLS